MLFIMFRKRFFRSGNPILGHVKIRFVSFQEISRKLNNKLTTELREDFARYDYSVSMKSSHLYTLGAHQYFKEQGISRRKSFFYHDKEMAISLFVTIKEVTSYAVATAFVAMEVMNWRTSEVNLALKNTQP